MRDAPGAKRAPEASGLRSDSEPRMLDTGECWRLLVGSDVARFVVRAAHGVDVFPVNYLVHDQAIYFRSAPGSKLSDLTRHPEVALEVDGQRAHRAWSVVVHGVAERLGSDREIEESGIHGLDTWYPGDKFNYVRITPTTITGRNFAKSPASD